VSGRLVLAACLVILAACYTAAVLAPVRLLAAIEIPLLALLAAVTAAAWRRRAGHRERNRPDHERHHP
jgi:Na+/H+ antiporter NhaD/arsenite permease-like protein